MLIFKDVQGEGEKLLRGLQLSSLQQALQHIAGIFGFPFGASEALG